jgi:hypothetical protein
MKVVAIMKHCFTLRKHPAENLKFRFGIASLKKRPFIQRKISLFVVHPEYSGVAGSFDIALIRLDHSITFQHNIFPICLPTNHENFNGTF